METETVMEHDYLITARCRSCWKCSGCKKLDRAQHWSI